MDPQPAPESKGHKRDYSYASTSSGECESITPSESVSLRRTQRHECFLPHSPLAEVPQVAASPIRPCEDIAPPVNLYEALHLGAFFDFSQARAVDTEVQGPRSTCGISLHSNDEATSRPKSHRGRSPNTSIHSDQNLDSGHASTEQTPRLHRQRHAKGRLSADPKTKTRRGAQQAAASASNGNTIVSVASKPPQSTSGPLFHHTDWEGRICKQRVHGPPPLSFDRYRDRYATNETQVPEQAPSERVRPRASTDVVVSRTTGLRVSGLTYGEREARMARLKKMEALYGLADPDDDDTLDGHLDEDDRIDTAEFTKAPNGLEDQLHPGSCTEGTVVLRDFDQHTSLSNSTKGSTQSIKSEITKGSSSDATHTEYSSIAASTGLRPSSRSSNHKLPNVTQPGDDAYFAHYIRGAESASTLSSQRLSPDTEAYQRYLMQLLDHTTWPATPDDGSGSEKHSDEVSKDTIHTRNAAASNASRVDHAASTGKACAALAQEPGYSMKPLPPLPIAQPIQQHCPNRETGCLSNAKQSIFKQSDDSQITVWPRLPEIERAQQVAAELAAAHTKLMQLKLLTEHQNSGSAPCRLGGSEAALAWYHNLDCQHISAWSDDDPSDEEGHANARIREIDPTAFGRAPFRNMREGMKGWREYVHRMLEEGKGPSNPKRLPSPRGRRAKAKLRERRERSLPDVSRLWRRGART